VLANIQPECADVPEAMFPFLSRKKQFYRLASQLTETVFPQLSVDFFIKRIRAFNK